MDNYGINLFIFQKMTFFYTKFSKNDLKICFFFFYAKLISLWNLLFLKLTRTQNVALDLT